MVVLKNCQPEISWILAELFNIRVNESRFLDCWKTSLVVPIFKNAVERSTPKKCCPVSLLSADSKILEKFLYNRPVEHLEKRGLLSDFWYGFNSSQSTKDLLSFLSDTTARAFNRPRPTWNVALVILYVFLQIHKSYQVQSL